MITSWRIEREARPEHLAELLGFIEAACRAADVSEDVAFAVRLASEEACTNVIKHAYPHHASGSICLHILRESTRIVVTVRDHGSRFHPEDVPVPTVNAFVEERELGGLGWHLIQRVMDEVHHGYDTTNGNTLTLVKRISTLASSLEHDMDISVEQCPAATIVRITGSVDGITAEALLTALQAQVNDGNVRLVGDLTGVSYTSSAGLRSLLATVKLARQKGGDFRLAGAVPAVHRVLELSGFTSIIKMYDAVDDAVASFDT